MYSDYTQEERRVIVKKEVEQDAMRMIVESNRFVTSKSHDANVDAVEIIKHRDAFLKSKFGIN